MLRLQHTSGQRTVFPKLRADLLFLATAIVAATSLALILSSPTLEGIESEVSQFRALAGNFDQTIQGDKSGLRNNLPQFDLSIDCLKNEVAPARARFTREPLRFPPKSTGWTGPGEELLPPMRPPRPGSCPQHPPKRKMP